MRVAVIDDEQKERDRLQCYLEQFSQEYAHKIDVCCYACGDELLQNYERVYDILIFDIDMPGTNGLDTARLIRREDANVVILFGTNIAQYAINGYEVDAVDYIIKPVGYYDFSMKLQKAVGKASHRKDKSIVIEAVGA